MNSYPCPCCNTKLAQAIEIKAGVHAFKLWCNNTNCNSLVCADGATGATAQEAFDSLKAKHQKETK
jgi:hypothetical protein